MSAITSSPASRPTIFGLFDRSTQPVHNVDIEAQHIVTPPSPARTQAPRALRASVEDTTHPIDDFFGASRPSRSRTAPALTGTRDSRHDERRISTPTEAPLAECASSSSSSSDILPPPYEHAIEPPAYTQVSDQPTLALYLFKFGFLFPLFWVAGSLILLSPLRAPDDWEATKPEVERAELIESMRRTEVKWAKRCLGALLIFMLVLAVVILAAFLVRRP